MGHAASSGHGAVCGNPLSTVASVVLGFRREHVAHPLDGFGMLIPGVEGFGILGAVFSSSLFPDRAPAGHVTLTAYVGGARHPELALQSEEAMVQLTLKDLRTLLGVNGPPTFQHIAVFKKAIRSTKSALAASRN